MAKSKKKMNSESYDTLTQLIELIYKATVEPECWLQFLESLSSVYGDHPIGLFSYDIRTKRLLVGNSEPIAHFVRADPGWAAEFKQYYCSINPWFERCSSLPDKTVVCSTDLIPDDIFMATEFYNDWLKNSDYKYALVAKVLQRDTHIISLFVLRTAPVSSYELEFLKQLIPHLHSALTLQMKMAHNRAVNDACFSVLNRFDMGVLLLDGKGRVRFTNHAAESILEKNEGFFVDQNNLCMGGFSAETDQLQRLIGQAILTGSSKKQGFGSAMRLNRKYPRKPLSVLISSLPCKAMSYIDKVCAVLFISDPDEDSQKSSAIDLLKRLYGLTLAQSNLALALGKGLSIEQYAEQQQLSVNTVRSHLKELLVKTRTHRQSELVRVLLTGPAFMKQAS